MSDLAVSPNLDAADSTRPFALVRPKRGIREEYCLIDGFGLAGRVHWNGERTILCNRRDDCEHCALHGPGRVESWRYALDHQGRVVILTLPRGASDSLKALEHVRGSLRGAVVRCTRTKGPRGPVQVEFVRDSTGLYGPLLDKLHPLVEVLKVIFEH